MDRENLEYEFERKQKSKLKWFALIVVVIIILSFMGYILFITTQTKSETIVSITECNSSFINETAGLLTNFNELSRQNTNCIAEKTTLNQKYLDQLNKVNELQLNISNRKTTTCTTCVRQVKELDARLEECYINNTNATIVAQNSTLLSMYINQTAELKNLTERLEVITTWLNQTINS